MSGTQRSKIVKAITSLIKTNVPEFFDNVIPKLKFWDEVKDFPHCSVSSTGEQREYLPSSFEWGYVTVSVRVYVNEDITAADTLDALLGKIEDLIRDNIVLSYDTGKETTDIRVLSVDTDGGLLEPLGVGELLLIVQYEVH